MRRAAFIGALGVALVGAIALRLWQSEPQPTLSAQPRTDNRPDVAEAGAAPHIDEPVAAEARSTSDENSYEARLAFHERVRGYFANPSAIPAAQRRAYADELAHDVIDHEARGELSADEARLLRIELVRTSVADERARDALIANITQEYEEATQARLAQWESQTDPNFELYKVREAEIVASVMQMSEIPGGLSRDEYLRQRLQQERERLMH